MKAFFKFILFSAMIYSVYSVFFAKDELMPTSYLSPDEKYNIELLSLWLNSNREKPCPHILIIQKISEPRGLKLKFAEISAVDAPVVHWTSNNTATIKIDQNTKPLPESTTVEGVEIKFSY